MSVVLKEIFSGRDCQIYAMGDEKGFQLVDFLGVLEQERSSEWLKILALLNRTADHGPPRNQEQCRYFKKERVFEFKTGGGVRIMAFWGANRFILCSHGFMKKRQKTPKGQLARAADARDAYEIAIRRDDVNILKEEGE